MSAFAKALMDAHVAAYVQCPHIIGKMHMLTAASDVLGKATVIRALEEASVAAAGVRDAIDKALAEARAEVRS